MSRMMSSSSWWERLCPLQEKEAGGDGGWSGQVNTPIRPQRRLQSTDTTEYRYHRVESRE
eukprot:802393-Pyramimonas_sp.AAC.2